MKPTARTPRSVAAAAGSDRPAERPARTPEQALAALMRLCARAEKAESDARRLMRGWGLAPADAERSVARLVADRFIDDRRYADAFVREKMRLSGWGAYKIRTALARKEIARETIDEALAAIDPATQRPRLEEQLRRKMRTLRSKTPYELKTKLIRYGLSLGYPYETVLDAASACVRTETTANDDEPCDEFFF